MRATERTYIDVETKILFRLYVNDETKNWSLIYDGGNSPTDLAKGSEVNGFFIAAHSGLFIKINNSKIIKLEQGEFYNLKDEETITHSKYFLNNRFTKLKN